MNFLDFLTKNLNLWIQNSVIKPELYDPLVQPFFIKIEGRGHHGLTQLPILLRQVVPKKDIVHTHNMGYKVSTEKYVLLFCLKFSIT